MKYYRYLSSEMVGNQAVQRSEIMHIILTGEVSGREREFLYHKMWGNTEGNFSEVSGSLIKFIFFCITIIMRLILLWPHITV